MLYPASKIERSGVGVVICLERGAGCLHMIQLMPLHPKTPSSLKKGNPYLIAEPRLLELILSLIHI